MQRQVITKIKGRGTAGWVVDGMKRCGQGDDMLTLWRELCRMESITYRPGTLNSERDLATNFSTLWTTHRKC